MLMMTGPGLLVLRLALAVVFVAHGAHKLFGLFNGPGIGPGGVDATAASFTALGLEPAFLLAVAAGLTQFLGGLLISVGLLTRWASLSLVVYVIIGIWTEHLKWGFYLNWVGDAGRGNGIEYSVVLLGALICLVVAGGGDWSIDGRREHSAEYRAAARARVRYKL